MRETAFIHRNKAKWQRLETALDGLSAFSGEELSELYIQLNDDLSYARTFYPEGKLPTYLNGLASRLHHHIYRNRRTQRGRFITFWREEVPLAMAATRRELALSATIFLVAVLIGAASARHDPTFVRIILGDEYVDRTLDNIERGEPMAIYGSMNEGMMFLGITANNIRVSLLAFALGLFVSFGTGYILFVNGVMLGSFQWFFHEHGVLQESLLTIWVHGTLEISAIVIAGAAGLTLGNSFLFPGTYTRTESFRRGARRGLKVVVGLVPVFIVAGFLESFVTRHALTLHPAVSITIITTSLAFLTLYFIILPFHAAQRAGRPQTGP